MKLGPYLLINLLLIGGAIYLYDASRPSPRRHTSEETAYDSLRADDLAISDGEFDAEPAMLDGGGNDRMVQTLFTRIESLEADIARLRGVLAVRAATEAVRAGGPPSSEVPVPDIRDVGDLENPVFDERTLTSLEAYVDEINRRKAETRRRDRIGQQLMRMDVDLTDTQQKAVIDQTIAYQQKAAELYKASWPKDEASRAERREAFSVLQEEFATSVNSLVPAAEAQKIIDSRIVRSRGFVSGARPNAAGGGNPKRSGRRR